jgi:amino acid transporter
MADKGLKSNVVGLFGGTMLGISSVAPAYTLTATLGLLAAAVAAKTPFVFIAGFLPMFFAAYAYREFNTIMPDAGTSFTWTSKGFGPYVGWLGGWAAVVACAIVLSNLAGVAAQFFYQFIGSAANSEMIGGLWENKWINVATVLVFIAIATYVAIEASTPPSTCSWYS